MKHNTFIFISVFTALFFASELFNPGLALATQAHGGIEGVISHQIAHLFFIVSMGFLIYWLRERQLVKESGWRFIQYGAFFLILWNINAFTVHLLSEQMGLIQIKKVGLWQVQINAVSGSKGLEVLYYIAKLDHLFCVPALIFLYFGLKRLLRESHSNVSMPEIQRESRK